MEKAKQFHEKYSKQPVCKRAVSCVDIRRQKKDLSIKCVRFYPDVCQNYFRLLLVDRVTFVSMHQYPGLPLAARRVRDYLEH